MRSYLAVNVTAHLDLFSTITVIGNPEYDATMSQVSRQM